MIPTGQHSQHADAHTRQPHAGHTCPPMCTAVRIGILNKINIIINWQHEMPHDTRRRKGNHKQDPQFKMRFTFNFVFRWALVLAFCVFSCAMRAPSNPEWLAVRRWAAHRCEMCSAAFALGRSAYEQCDNTEKKQREVISSEMTCIEPLENWMERT